MPKITYISKRFSSDTLVVIMAANNIITEYQEQGFTLTLRQLYYQFVARGLLPNKQSEYKRLGGIISDARLAGLVDWYSIEDRTRYLRSRAHWSDPAEIIEDSARGYSLDMWEGQPYRPEVWIEKDALVGVIEGVCNELDTPYFACRGYSSQSEQWRAGRRLANYSGGGQKPIIFHLGDHDPSGIDMTRDNRERLWLFGGELELRRLALNMDQVETHNPPPNPAKLSDSRAAGYVAKHGYDSWELDALEPAFIAELIRDAINDVRDLEKWDERAAREAEERDQLSQLSARWGEVVEFLAGG